METLFLQWSPGKVKFWQQCAVTGWKSIAWIGNIISSLAKRWTTLQDRSKPWIWCTFRGPSAGRSTEDSTYPIYIANRKSTYPYECYIRIRCFQAARSSCIRISSPPATIWPDYLSPISRCVSWTKSILTTAMGYLATTPSTDRIPLSI